MLAAAGGPPPWKMLLVARMEEGAKQAGAIGRWKSDPGKAEQATWKQVLREPTVTPATKRTQ
jgi:hypothetical protein